MTGMAFNFFFNGSGNVRHWSFVTPDPNISTNVFDRNNHAIRFYISSVYSLANSNAEVNAVRNCFGQWQSVPNTVIKFQDAGMIPPGYDVNTSDNSNVVYWATTSTLVNGGNDNISGALAVTYATFSVPGNVIQQFDIVVNGVEQGWFTDFNDKNNTNYFVEGTLLHEIGHSLGMAHSAMGGATLLWAGNTGVDTQAGLSPDEVAYGRTLYPSGSILSTLGNLKGTVTKDGSPILGAAVLIEGTNGNLIGGTVTLSDGSYRLNAISPGSYNVRVTPLEPISAFSWLIRGPDIANPDFNSADTSFLATSNTSVVLTAGTTNTLDLAVVNSEPAFRITQIRMPSATSFNFAWVGLPASMTLGQSNFFIGVASETLPTSAASLTITGDGLTLGAPTFNANLGGSGLNFISVPISVASNATPGLRTFIVTQGTNRAYANGYLEILPAVADYNFDGLDDSFQRKYFFPFTSTNAAPTADPDGDGMNNYAESVAGTIPTNAASLLKMQSVTVTNNGRVLRWQSVSGKRYQVSTRTNLLAGSWQNIGAPVSAVSTTAQYLDTPITNGARFYRVQALP
jgi:hypothetical protein